MAYKLLNNCWNWRFKYFCRSISYRKLHRITQQCGCLFYL